MTGPFKQTPLLAVAAALLSSAALRAQLGADRSATNIVVVSGSVLEPAWKRRVVMSGPDGRILNGGGAVGSAAANAAAGEAASRAGGVSDAAMAALDGAAAALNSALPTAATNAIALALSFHPERAATNLVGYVVKTETDGTNDTQYVWYSRDIALAPNRFVRYETFGASADVKAEWADWASKTNVEHNGLSWEGCRVCTAARPDWARGLPCLDLPNDTLGGAEGFDFGDLLLTVAGVPAYTGFVTNRETGAVLYFDNGFLKSIVTENEDETTD